MRLRLELLSDTLFASGFGLAHHLDADVEHDLRTGLPVVRGRTLKGLLTEGCAEVLAGLGQTENDDRFVQAALEAFGVPGSTEAHRGRLRVGHARLPLSFQSEVKSRVQAEESSPAKATTEQVLGSLTTVRRRTAIDEETGTASKGSLRAQRMLRQGLFLDAPLDADGLTPDARFLVALAAAAVQNAGMSRARGAGHLRLTVYDGATNLTEKALAALEAAGEALPEVSNDFAPPKATPLAEGDGGGTALRIRFRLDQPLLVRGGKGDPNTGVGLPCIPGSSLRGAAIGRYLAAKPRGLDLAADPQARRLFFDGKDVRFLAAYPVDDGTRALPTPASWFADKLDKTRGADSASGLDPEMGDWRRIKKPFVRLGAKRRVVEPERVVNVHIQRARGYGVQNETDRTVYRYDALAEGQLFEALVLCADAETCRTVAGWFPVGARFSFGTAGTAGYGGVTVVAATAEHGAEETPNGSEKGDEAMVVFTAPVALRDPHTGLFTTDSTVLGAELGGTVETVWGGTERPAGFNRKWGLPLPQHPVWQAGTTVKLSGVDRDKLQALQKTGVGERLAEGFGRFVVDAFSSQPTWQFDKDDHPATEPERTDLAVWPEGYEETLRRKLNDCVGREATRDRIVAQAGEVVAGAELASAEEQRLTRTQLEAVQRLLEAPNKATALKMVNEHFEKMPQDARRKWRSARVAGNVRLNDWIVAHLQASGGQGNDGDRDAKSLDWSGTAALVRTVLELLAKRSAL